MSIFDRALFIPAEHRAAAPGRPGTERVLLPLAARAGWAYGIAGLAAGLVAAACGGVGIVLALGDVVPGLGLLMLLAALLPATIAGTAAHDLSQQQPVLRIDTDGFRDTRFDADGFIRWADVRDAEILRGPAGIDAVRLVLAVDLAPAYNPCRIGGWSASWRQRRRTRTIAVRLLDRRSHVLAHAMLALVARSGDRTDVTAGG